MPCNHKFKRHIDLSQLDFEPTTMIVGTFNPEWPASNTAEWFYGRTAKNNFWDVLPRLYGMPSLINAGSVVWKQFCKEQKIALSDLISCIDDADEHNKEHQKIIGGFSDEALAFNFDDIEFVPIVQLLKKHPTIKNVYLTRGISEAYWRHLWNPVIHYCSLNGLRERRLLTPSGNAFYQHGAHNNDHPNDPIPLLEDYILRRWQQEWHF